MRIIPGIVLIFFFSISNYAQEVLTLQEAINIALQKNTLLKKAENNIKTYESSLKASYGNLIPSFSASGSFRWNRSEDEGTTLNIGGAVFTTPPSVTESRTYGASVDASWTLFDGLSNFASISQSKDELKSAELSLKRLKQDIVFQVVNLYYDVVNAKKLLEVRKQDVKWNEKNLETIQERNKLGAVTLADVYSQQVRLGNAELELIRTQNLLETSKANLLYYLGIDVLENYQLADELTKSELDVLNEKFSEDFDNISVLVNQAMDERPDYKSAQLDLESALSGITIARSGHFPRLTNNYSFSSYVNKIDNLFKSKTYSVGLTLSVPIFSGFSVENRVQLAEVQAMNLEVELDDLKREIKLNIQQTYLDLLAAEKALDVSQRNVLAAEENRKIEQEKYSLGSGKLLDVLIANSEYVTAQQNYIDAQFAYVILREQLKYYLGVLDYKQFEN